MRESQPPFGFYRAAGLPSPGIPHGEDPTAALGRKPSTKEKAVLKTDSRAGVSSRPVFLFSPWARPSPRSGRPRSPSRRLIRSGERQFLSRPAFAGKLYSPSPESLSGRPPQPPLAGRPQPKRRRLFQNRQPGRSPSRPVVFWGGDQAAGASIFPFSSLPCERLRAKKWGACPKAPREEVMRSE